MTQSPNQSLVDATAPLRSRAARLPLRAALALALLAGLSACSGGPSEPTSIAEPAVIDPPVMHRPQVAGGQQVPYSYTASDGYPNVNVDTAARPRSAVHSRADLARIEADLVAASRSQSAEAGSLHGKSFIEELKAARRRQAVQWDDDLPAPDAQ